MREDRLAAFAGLVAISVAVVSQLPAREDAQRVKERQDVYLLPPPEHMRIMSLGHRAAVADVLWASLLVGQGLRLSERRRFDIAIEYLDAINELDPKWRDPYKLADVLVTMQAKAAPLDQVRAVRRILERGVRERPTDAELYLVLGVFVAFIVPSSYLDDDPVEAEQWRRDGVEYLARAAELAPNDSNIPWQTLGGAKIFARMGRLDRAVEMYSTILATTDDPELRERVEWQLGELRRARNVEEAQVYTQARRRALEAHVLSRIPGAYETGKITPLADLLGPARDPARCSGGGLGAYAMRAACAGTWSDWAKIDPGAKEPLDAP